MKGTFVNRILIYFIQRTWKYNFWNKTHWLCSKKIKKKTNRNTNTPTPNTPTCKTHPTGICIHMKGCVYYATGDVRIVNMQWRIHPQFAGDIQVVYPQLHSWELLRGKWSLLLLPMQGCQLVRIFRISYGKSVQIRKYDLCHSEYGLRKKKKKKTTAERDYDRCR